MIDLFTWICWLYGVIALLIACFVVASQGRRWQTFAEGGFVGALWLLIVVALAAYICWLSIKGAATCAVKSR